MNTLFKAFIFLSPLLYFNSLLANDNNQKAIIKGIVTTSNGAPTEMVTVSINGLNRSTTTGAEGKYIFRNIENGSYVLKISLVGYDSMEKEITVANNEIKTVNFQLTSSSIELAEVFVKTTGRKLRNFSSNYVTKMPLKNIENPQVYSSIDKTILENQMLFTVDDAFRNAAGVQKMLSATNRAGVGGAYINMRGFVASNFLRNGLVAPVTTTIDAVNIEKIEILKGPSATLFGSNVTSYGGAVNRVTKKPYDVFGGNISVIGGSYNFYRAQADINTPLTKNKKLLFRLNSAYTLESTFQNKNAINKYFVLIPSLTYKFNEKLDVNLEYEYFYTKALLEQVFFYLSPALGVNNMKDLEKTGLNYKNSYIGSGLYTTAKISNLLGQINYKVNDHIRSVTIVNSSGSFSNGFNPYFAIAPQKIFTKNPADVELGVVRADLSTRNSRQGYFQVQQNFNADFSIGGIRNRAVVGLDYLKTKDNQVFHFFYPFDWAPFNGADYTTMNENTASEKYRQLQNTHGHDFNAQNTQIREATLNTYSGYIADVLTLAESLNVLASLRYENNNFKGGKLGISNNPAYTQAAWSPKFGLVYEIVKDKFSVFGNYQNSFKSNGYYISDNRGASSLSAPETANQAEGGFKANMLNGKINAVVSYYNIDVKNTLLTTTEPVIDNSGNPTGKFVQNQVGRLASKGFELEIDAYLVKGFSLIGGVSYNDSKFRKADRDVEGRRSNTASSPWLANFNASYQFLDGKLKGLGLGIGGNYASDNKIVNAARQGTFILPKYFVLNSNIFFDAKKFRIGIKADNFTNQHYWTGYTSANPQKLTNVLGSFTYKF